MFFLFLRAFRVERGLVGRVAPVEEAPEARIATRRAPGWNLLDILCGRIEIFRLHRHLQGEKRVERGQTDRHAAAACQSRASLLHSAHCFGTNRGGFYALSGRIKRLPESWINIDVSSFRRARESPRNLSDLNWTYAWYFLRLEWDRR